MKQASTLRHYFGGRTLILATKHQKERVMQSPLEATLGVSVVVPPDFDTDQFGMFSGEVARPGDQLTAARAKARAALAHTGADLVVVSEGAFGPDPLVPLVQSGRELVLLIDSKHDLEVFGVTRSKSARVAGATVRSVEEAVAFAEAWGFPGTGVVLKATERATRGVIKDFASLAALESAVAKQLHPLWRRSLYLATDLRAYQNPGRMEDIAHATDALLMELSHQCPVCARPGFSVKEVTAGAPCSACGVATALPLSETRRCAGCAHSEIRTVVPVGGVDPGDCERCNP